ncbi:protein jagged-1-like [Lampetra fluviatilis]
MTSLGGSGATRVAVVVSAAVLLCLLIPVREGECSGQFELEISWVRNPDGELQDGGCCDGDRGDPPAPASPGPAPPGGEPQGRCSTRDECDTFFRGCLREYQARVQPAGGACAYGSGATSVLGGNSFRPRGSAARMLVTFHFAWPRAFTLILEAWDQDNDTTAGGSELIERSVHSGMMNPGEAWRSLQHHGATAHFQYRVRVRCDEHYYGAACNKLCRPRDDFFGHYTCDAHGDKACVDGWMGASCNQAICKQGCDGVHGYCNVPGECRCQYGWQGALCGECIPYPGCVHGSCSEPWQCHCDTNWGGLLCDKDLNYCGTHSPCLNGGTCINPEPDEFECVCPEGWSGRNCEIAEHACLSGPCAPGATCVETPHGFECQCGPGWSGATCADNVDDCSPNPCGRGATCRDLVGGFECLCLPQWRGRTCQLDANECERSPCVNAHSCRNLIGGYYCDCLPGWTGHDCDTNIDDCVGQCRNGGSCTDLVNGYRCECRPGFSGPLCQVGPGGVVASGETGAVGGPSSPGGPEPCPSGACFHGGRCVSETGGTSRCDCPPGFAGDRCQNAVGVSTGGDPCSSAPCRNGGTCTATGTGFECSCGEDHEGADCSKLRDHCHTAPCQVIDSCTVAVASNTTAGGVRFVSSGVCGPHGRCASLPGGRFSCSCLQGFTGTYCHQNINDCQLNPCHNGGTCIDGVSAFQCVCPEGWEGDLCQTDINDCHPNPCHNGGRCRDLVNDFQCQCRNGWKGRTCHSRESQCDETACHNGGTCYDHGDSFVCHCPLGWEGSTCSVARNSSCASSPCQNGGTCVGGADSSSFTCVCRDGWEGPTCAHNTNDCNPHPCYNGGTCVDGDNWYRCECSPGFAGPDCRINIDECQSSPCAAGSTCMDEINAFRCVCPLGRSGSLCQEAAHERPCFHHGRLRAHGSRWDDECNACECSGGLINCTRVWCGDRPCSLRGGARCGSHQTCRPVGPRGCLAPPCADWGECWPPREPPRDACLPSDPPHSDARCSRITLYFNPAHMQPGLTVEQVCSELRFSPALRDLPPARPVVLLCEAATPGPGQVTVTVSVGSVLSGSRGGPGPQGPGSLRDVTGQLLEAIQQLQVNGTALRALAEVKVEILDRAPREPGFLLPLLAVLIGVLWLACLLALGLLWLCRQRRAKEHKAFVSVLPAEVRPPVTIAPGVPRATGVAAATDSAATAAAATSNNQRLPLDRIKNLIARADPGAAERPAGDAGPEKRGVGDHDHNHHDHRHDHNHDHHDHHHHHDEEDEDEEKVALRPGARGLRPDVLAAVDRKSRLPAAATAVEYRASGPGVGPGGEGPGGPAASIIALQPKQPNRLAKRDNRVWGAQRAEDLV